MEIILAQKGKHTREFTRAAWDRLGKEKSGWAALPPEAQKGTGTKTATPPPPPPPAPKAPQAKTVDQLRKELADAIAAEEAASETESTPDQSESENEYTGPYSTDEGTSWQAAVKHIKTLETAEAVNNYVAEGDDRKTIQGAKALRLEELK